jgi:hypothetical protein
MKLTKSNSKVFSTILLGFLLFGLKEFAELISGSLPRIFALIGLLFIFVAPFWYKYKIVTPLRGGIKILFYGYLIWIFVIILTPLITGQEYTDKSIHPYANYGVASYLLPFVVLLGINIISLSKLFKMIFIFSIIGFVFFVFNFNTMQSVVLAGIGVSLDGEIGIGELANKYFFWFNISCLSLLCYEFVPKNYKKFAIFTSIFTFLLITYFARRGGIFMYLLYFFGMFYLYLDQSNSKYRFLRIMLLAGIILIFYLIISNYSNSFFSLIFERLYDDSRSSVDDALIAYLNAENAWLFGKGIEGTYKHSDFDLPRYEHETGYLYLILKGGIINLFFYVTLLLHAFYIGFFKTKNRLTKALALYVFFHIVFLIPFGLPNFGLEYLFVWIAFAICESTHYRSMNNQEIKQYLTKNNIN